MDNAPKHGQLAQILIDREVIFTEDVEKIFGKRPWKSRADEIREEEEKAAAQSGTEGQNATDNDTEALPPIPSEQTEAPDAPTNSEGETPEGDKQ